jgi:hypothetical protein
MEAAARVEIDGVAVTKVEKFLFHDPILLPNASTLRGGKPMRSSFGASFGPAFSKPRDLIFARGGALRPWAAWRWLSAFCIIGRSCLTVLSLWHGKHKTWQFSRTGLPPRPSGMM